MHSEERLLLTSNVISATGDVCYDLFMMWTIYASHHSLTALSAIIGSSFVFKAVAALMTGRIVDHFNRKRLMIINNFLLALFCLLTLTVIPSTHTSLGLYLLLVFGNELIGGLFSKAYTVFTSDLFDKKHYIMFTSLSRGLSQMIAVFGNAAVGYFSLFSTPSHSF